MTKEPAVGEKGWLAYLEAYPIYVEFLGFQDYEPDYSHDPTRYYRALTGAKRKGGWTCNIEVGHIVDESGEFDEVLFDTKEEAEEVCRDNAAYWLKRKEKELEEYRERAGLS